MNNLSQECIEQIEKESAKHYPTCDNTNQLANMHTLGYCRGAKKALTNPTIYQSAGLMTVEEALSFAEFMNDFERIGETVEKERQVVYSNKNKVLGTLTELLTIFRNQNQEK